MNRDEILEYLTEQIDLLQRKAVELQEQHDEIEKQLKAYKELHRMYRGVYESEAGVGLLNKVPSEILKILEEKLNTTERASKKNIKMETKTPRTMRHDVTSDIRTPLGKGVAWAVQQILSRSDGGLNTRQVYQLVKNSYPAIAEKPKRLFHTVESALSRGYQRGLYERSDGVYRLKDKKVEER